MGSYYDRYAKFRSEGEVSAVPFIKIESRATDVYATYDKESTRLDALSYKYYNDPGYGWLILQANPWLPSMEYLIPDGATIRIPYPLSQAISSYESGIQQYFNEMG